ncbi:hypothetical protein FHG71_03960 [Rubellimicrobium roseum]|uniref:Uncharacterized protein n=1 Tax=Rubellimicrobium roseum TaxID=687525 RepID=A0A5C4NIC0_9RHOB|nr:hypothetical protein FHG71_03960 [Rubellimicrobium roseum]
MLARFQDYLNVGRWDAAATLLDRLRGELRIDALNLKSLQVQLLAAREDWIGITDLPGFANLLNARRTPAVTALLLEALYRTHLAQAFDDPEEARRIYANKTRPLALPLLSLPRPSPLSQGGWRLCGLEALESPSRRELRLALVGHEADLGWVADRLGPAEPPAPTPQSSADSAQTAIATMQATESLDAMAAALAALSRLTDDQRQALGQLEPMRTALQALDAEVGASTVPTSWTEWLGRVSDPGFTSALDVARLGAEEWRLDDVAHDPEAVRAFLDALNAIQSDNLAAERTFHALPFIVATMRRDDTFPSPVLVPAYAGLLTLLALGVTRGSATFQSSRVLVEALLSIGLNAKRYGDLVADLDEIAGEGFGADMAYWALDIVETIMRAATPDVRTRERFVHGVLARLVPIRARMSSLQRAAADRLAIEFGWDFGAADANDAPDDGLMARLSGKKVSIYSLSETASRQAKAELERSVNDIRVECNADHVGTAALKALATNSDLFVIVWSAAKHAATDFIRANRGNRPLVYAKGKGVSSILCAVEEHIRQVKSSN